MLENAKRQLILVVLVTTIAALLATLLPFKLGFDLRGGTQLIYDVPVREEQARSDDEDFKAILPARIMQDVLRIIGDRIDPSGTRDISPVLRGETGMLIELPDFTDAEVQEIKRSIETLGKLETRAVATSGYKEQVLDDAKKETGEEVTFDLGKESKRLRDWLDKDGNRASCAEDPAKIELFNLILASDEDDADGRVSRFIKWYPRKIRREPKNPRSWEYALSQQQSAGNQAVAAFTDDDYAKPPSSEGDPFLVEFIAINMHEVNFTGEDMNPVSISSGTDRESGTPAVFYSMKESVATAYADFTEKHKGELGAIILNGVVRSIPTYVDRIFRHGRISGGFTAPEATALAKVLRTGSLPVKPVPVSSETIGPELGAESVLRGMYSIIIGGLLVLVFILAYYRLAGFVAFSAIVLNIVLILGIMQFLQATFTLPGLAGLVLTMGMAIDANILIYERIKEELKRGKELVQAVRHGFERAMVTILDANITTFLTGLVLFNVGVGPVRGFAVTLMVGIITSVFTAFFVSRLVFHFLIDRKKLTEFHSASWLSNAAFDFLSKRKIAFAFSAIVIVGGLAHFVAIPKEKVFGLDFTGGANLNVALSAPATSDEIRNQLLDNDDFARDFPEAAISTMGKVEAGQARKFSIKLKLTDALREKIEAAKKAFTDAATGDAIWEPPYKILVAEILADRLVQPAFSDISKIDVTGNVIGRVTVHFTEQVKIADAATALKDRFGRDVSALPVDEASAVTARDVQVEFQAVPTWTEADYMEKVREAFTPDRNGKGGLRDINGNVMELSNPIPAAAEIGGRMVGELRNAAIGALVLSLILIVFYIRIRFHEYKYGFAAVAALLHDVAVVFGIVVLANQLGIVNAELNLAMIAAFLTIIGYSINDTIVIFDRVRENVSDSERLGDSQQSFRDLLNRSINQTLSRTVLTSGTTLFVVMAQFVANYGQPTALEGFSFALIAGVISGTYSTIFIASPVVLWLRSREKPGAGSAESAATSQTAPEPAGV